MKKRSIVLLFGGLLLGLAAGIFAASHPDDAEGCQDPAQFTRMPGYHIYHCEEKQFDRYEVPVGSDFKTQAHEGRYRQIVYWINEGATQASGLQIIRNYSNAAMAVAGKKIVEFEDGGVHYVTLKIAKGSLETWLHVAGHGGEYFVHILEKQLMKQDVVADAASLSSPSRSRHCARSPSCSRPTPR